MSKISNRELVITFLESQDVLGKFNKELLKQKHVSVYQYLNEKLIDSIHSKYNLPSIIGNAFSFSKSKLGVVYWVNIDKEWRNYLLEERLNMKSKLIEKPFKSIW